MVGRQIVDWMQEIYSGGDKEARGDHAIHSAGFLRYASEFPRTSREVYLLQIDYVILEYLPKMEAINRKRYGEGKQAGTGEK